MLASPPPPPYAFPRVVLASLLRNDQYINIDAGYLLHERDNVTGKLQVDPAKFPRGMRYVADQLHSKNLKLGVYTDLGEGSCGKGPGSFASYALDAATVALDWQADYLKVDFCGSKVSKTDPALQLEAWEALGTALNKTGRRVYYSTCPHTTAPDDSTAAQYRGRLVYSPPAAWSAAQRQAVGNSLLVEYLNTFDLWYADTVPAGDGGPIDLPGGVITNIDAMVRMTNLSYSGPGSWADADMMQLCTYGEGATRHFPHQGLTLVEYESHLAVWSVLASPLIHSADLRTVGARHPECLSLMLNGEVLAVNQDAAGLPPRVVFQQYNVSASAGGGNSSTIVAQAFARQLSGGRTALVLLNRAEGTAVLAAKWAELGFPEGATMAVRDVLRKADMPPVAGKFEASVPKHGVAFVVLSPSA